MLTHMVLHLLPDVAIVEFSRCAPFSPSPQKAASKLSMQWLRQWTHDFTSHDPTWLCYVETCCTLAFLVQYSLISIIFYRAHASSAYTPIWVGSKNINMISKETEWDKNQFWREADQWRQKEGYLCRPIGDNVTVLWSYVHPCFDHWWLCPKQYNLRLKRPKNFLTTWHYVCRTIRS
jgi:hypothetical protein